jgi:sigma-B regulation protein RsbU (phosphoserine phosphatase)
LLIAMDEPSLSISRGSQVGTAWFRKPWRERLGYITEMMREVSLQTEPQGMVEVYGRRMRQILESHASVSLSRRDLEAPFVRVTRASVWQNSKLNPWKNRDKLPVIKSGLLSDLIYGEEPVMIDDLVLAPDDPANEYLAGMRSLTAIPLFESGEAINMVVLAREELDAFSNEFLPEHLWLSNLFGRATANLVLKEELRIANARMESELKVVADIQRSLLPVELPKIPGLDIAAFYQTSRHAGGDYYDFFPLDGGKLGILIADVSGHGTPAAVMMAVTHSIAHTHHEAPTPPSKLLNFINRHLTARYTGDTGTFVTAFYGIYDPATQTLTFANAGHNPPRLKRGCGGPNGIIEGQSSLPLGIEPNEVYYDNVQQLQTGDTLVIYTDGITEARNAEGELFDTERLDAVLTCTCDSAQSLIDATVAAVNKHTDYAMPQDDRTMLVITIGGEQCAR